MENRRPLKSRSSKTLQNIAYFLAKRNITPNQISLTSIAFAFLGAGCMFYMPYGSGGQLFILPVLTALAIQGRLLCNLFDGMVAIESGKKTASGELFNDIPDRIADPVLLIAAGYAATLTPWAHILGWSAALLAILTAYVRTLAKSIGAPADFRGPMAKQHRMALLTVALVLTALEPLLQLQGNMLFFCLIIIIAGTVITLIRRIHAAYTYLERGRA